MPHYNHYQDINSDCIPDLFLTTYLPGSDKYYSEVYVQTWDETFKGYRFCKVIEQELESDEMQENFSTPILSDFNKDGSIDILYSV